MAAQRFEWLDFANGFLMILVFVYHSEVIYGDWHSWSWLFDMFFLSGFFSVPGFLFTSDLETVSFTYKLKQNIRGILITYFIFVGVLLLPKLIILGKDVTQSLIDYVLLRSSWFVIVIGLLSIIFAAVVAVSGNKRRGLLILTVISVAISYLFVLLYRLKPDWLAASRILYSPDLPNRLPLCLNLFFVAAPFFAVGILLREKFESFKKIVSVPSCLLCWILFFALIILDRKYIGSDICFAMNGIVNPPLVYLYSFLGIMGVFMFAFLLQGGVKYINFIGRNAIIFYFLNAVALRAVSKMAGFSFISSFMDGLGYLGVVIVAVDAVAMTFPIVRFIRKYIPFIVGDKEAFNRVSKKFGLNIKW